MPVCRLPVRPDLEQLQRQAKELLRAIHNGEANAVAELREHHPESIDSSTAKLADAQLALARSYHAPSWTRLVHAVRLADAIWRDDSDTVRELITHNPVLIQEHVLIQDVFRRGQMALRKLEAPLRQLLPAPIQSRRDLGGVSFH